MSPEKTKKLFERFNFFKPNLPDTVSLMCYGFECRDGWFDLLWELCLGIEKELNRIDEENKKNSNTKEKVIDLLHGIPSPFRVDQVKEKFGDLRFYTNWETDEITRLIRIAEQKSAITCEECGKPAHLMSKNNWYKTICVECAPEGYEPTKEQ